MTHSASNDRTGGRRGLALLTALLTLTALTVPLVGTASANHDTRTLNVTPEYQKKYTDEFATLTATLSRAAENETINIDFEMDGGSLNDKDGASYQSPDATCDISPGDISCSITYQGTVATPDSNPRNPDQWRVWIDHDKTQTSTEADLDEGVQASEKDCLESDPSNTSDDCPSDPTNNTFYEGGTGGTQCSGRGTTPTNEPDCTDVVEVDWDNRDSVATTLDCDDTGTPDTERETVPEGGSEEYRCVVRSQFGSTMSGQKVYGEVETPTNDPDTPDSVSYTSPDYTCQSPDGQTGRDPAVPPGFSAENVCYITVEQVEGELGTAEICFWSGTIEDGATLCASEPTGENQLANGSDTGNDLADQVELTWEDVSTFRLDCEPETDSTPVGQPHEVTCTAISPTSGRAVSDVEVLVEIVGAGDSDRSNSPQTPDDACTTEDGGSCSFFHTSTETGETTYRAWIEDGDSAPDEILRTDGTDPDMDRTEGQNESATPGEILEPDATDVVTNTWVPAPSTLEMTPESDSAQVGECNPYTITVMSGSGSSVQPAAGITIDVEQIHTLAANQTTGDEPTVGFCEPTSGPNPSDVDESRGDRQPAADETDTGADEEDPDNKGTAGGETVKTTDANGQITIGINVVAGQGSDGSGQVEITAFYDPNDNDDPDASEPKDTSTKTWTAAAAGTGGRAIDCEPETATTNVGSSHTVTCTVTNATGGPQSGVSVTFTESGPGTIQSSSTVTTGSDGKATVTVTSNEEGEQTITGTITSSTQNEPDTDECNRAAGDPSGSQQGACSDSVTNTWTTGTTEDPECSDGLDNDSDGDIDFPDDQGCSDAADDTENTDTPRETCPGFEQDPRNQVVGTEGSETLEGTEGPDIICGLGGDDLIIGHGGDDLLIGGAGNDSIRGGDGDDSMKGGAGKDELRGNGGDDVLRGGNQNDDLRGNAGNDVMYGGIGFDVLRGGAGNDKGFGGSGNDTLQGFTGNDTLVGNAGNDTIKGADHRDILRGGKDDDVISGGKGPDSINGGSGRDVCSGGPGNDRVIRCEN